MSSLIRKFVAVSVAIWLPLFSGNALAVAVAMQGTGDDGHHAAVQQHDHHATAHHIELATNHEQPPCHQDTQTSESKCGICHLACCGYLATVSIIVAEVQALTQSFTPSSAQFESASLSLLDPPPLARI